MCLEGVVEGVLSVGVWAGNFIMYSLWGVGMGRCGEWLFLRLVSAVGATEEVECGGDRYR